MFDQYQEMGNGGNEKKVWKVLLVILLISSLGAGAYAAYQTIPISWTIPGAFSIETLPATDIETNSVTLNGNVSNFNISSGTIWFEYGTAEESYTYRTKNQTITSKINFSQKVEGIQLMPGSTYHFKAVGTGSGMVYGDDLTFTMEELSALEVKNFGKHYEELEESKFNISKLATVIPKTYTDLMLESRIFYGLFFGIIFLALWIRQEDITIPALLGMIVGGSIFAFMPIEWMKLAQALFIVSLGACIYSLVKGRK